MPHWAKTIDVADVFHDEDLTFEERRDTIVARVQESGWPDENTTVAALIDELADAEDAADFDSPWSLIYDEADADRVWIATF